MGPHFGLMESDKMSPAEAARLRARLHWRGGRRRLRQGKTALAVVTLYDALLSGLRWYFLVNQWGTVAKHSQTDLENEGYLFSQAEKAGVFDVSLELPKLRTLVEQALRREEICPEPEWFVARVEELLTRIGILPFAEESLPPEDPTTD